MFLTVGITYESDLKKAKELLAREVRKQPAFLDIRTEQQKKDGVPDVPVVVLELADSAVVLRATPLHSRSSAPCSRALSLPMTRKALILHIRTCKS